MESMKIQDFIYRGLLQLVNRQLHPYGVALAYMSSMRGSKVHEEWGLSIRSTTDPEGICFAPEDLSTEKEERLEAERKRREPHRRAALGYWIQPVRPGTGDEARMEKAAQRHEKIKVALALLELDPRAYEVGMALRHLYDLETAESAVQYDDADKARWYLEQSGMDGEPADYHRLLHNIKGP